MSSFIHKAAQRNTIILKLFLSGVYWIGNEPKELFFICKNDKSQNYCTFKIRLSGADSDCRNVRTCKPWKILLVKNRGNVVRNRENVVKNRGSIR